MYLCVPPVLCLRPVAAEADTLVLLSSSLMPVLLESRQMASGLTDFTSFNTVDADDDDTCFVTSPGEMDSYDPAVEKVKRKESKIEIDIQKMEAVIKG